MNYPLSEEAIKRRRRRRRGIVNVLLLILVLAASFMFLRSPLFAVEDVEIKGINRLSPAEVLDWSGLQGPLFIWEVDTATVARRVAAHPAVQGAAVERGWPNRVIIDIMERQPVAVLRYRHLWVLVDEAGVPFGLETQQPRNLPLLITDEPEQLALGEVLPRHLVAAAQLAAYRRQYALTWIEAIEPTDNEFVLWLTGEIPAYFGDATDRPDRKLAILKTLWTSWNGELAGENRPLQFIDVRNPERPIVQTTVAEEVES